MDLLESLSANLQEEFHVWKSRFNKNYLQGSDHVQRLQQWLLNNDFIKKHNEDFERGINTFKIAHNVYSDLSEGEFGQLLKGFNRNLHFQSRQLLQSSNFTYDDSYLPDSVDWRDQGYVNPIQNQKQCGSCYAFSSVAAIEGQYFKSSGSLLKLSEQHVVDCASSYGNYGCNGGIMNNVFKFVKDNGIAFEDSYPYQARVQGCSSGVLSPVKVNGFVDLPEGDENALQQAVASKGPISVGIDASLRSFQLYESGIYNDPNANANSIDHAVVVVGYGSENGQDYWIVRNSWGEGWGENGYVRMARNQGNFAGIASMASYPLVDDSNNNTGNYFNDEVNDDDGNNNNNGDYNNDDEYDDNGNRNRNNNYSNYYNE